MRYRVLGPLEAGDDGDGVELGPLKHRLLLARLLVDRNEIVVVDDLLEALWDTAPPATAVKTLQVYVSQLRQRVGSTAIERHPAGYLLRASDDDVDSAMFERLFLDGRARAGAGKKQLAAAILDRALQLWRGPAFADTRYADFATAEGRRLDDLRIECQEERLAIDLDLGRHVGALTELRSLVEQHPHRERLRGLEMLALYRCARQVEALDTYRAYRQLLLDELGLEPGPEIAALNGAILRQEPELAAAGTNRIERIPAPPTAFIGRRAELDALSALLAEDHVRLVSLVGAGGSGKTRLAIELAAKRRAEFENGVVVVELAAAADEGDVLAALADALRMPDVAEPELAEWLADRELLLVADNVEHLVDAGPLLVRLLSRAPRLRVVATSRAVLHVSGEHVFAVAPLREEEAVELFAARARALAVPLDLGTAGAELAREICQRLDCLPLAVELAAAHTRTLSLPALLERTIERVGEIGGGLRDLPARQQTLHATLTWSTALLTPDVRASFAPLGVFVDGMAYDAAAFVGGGRGEAVETLVDHSLVTRVESDESTRYRMLETVREHALELLADARPAAEERHASFYLALVEASAPGMQGPDLPTIVRRLRVDEANLRLALRTMVSRGQIEERVRFCAALWPYWSMRGHLSEGRANLEAALAAAPREFATPALLRVLRGAAIFANSQGDYERSVELAREQRTHAARSGDVEMESSTLTILASAAIARGDASEAAILTRQAVELLAGAEHERDRAFALINLGNAELNLGSFEACRVASLESVRLFEACGDGLRAATPLHNAGLASLELGALDEASRLLHESFDRICELDHVEYVANGLDSLAGLAVARGIYETAARRHGAANAIRLDAGSNTEPYERELRARTASAIVHALGAERMTELSDLGASDPWQVVAEALARP